MEVRVSENTIDICSGDKDEVRKFCHRLYAAGAKYACIVQQDPDDETFFAAMQIPENDSKRRVLYLVLRTVAGLRGCDMFLDVYTRKDTAIRRQYFRIKGPAAHEPAFVVLAYRITGGGKRVHVYTNHPDLKQRYPGPVEPVLSLTLTGLNIIHERRLQ